MPMAMGIVWDIIKYPIKSKQLADLLDKFDEVLGLKIAEKDKNTNNVIPDNVMKLVEERKLARESKEWEKSDILRDEIQKLGYIVKDTKNGTEITKA